MTEPTEKCQVVDLWQWCATILGNAAVTALFGNVLLQIEPRLLEYVYSFDSESWKLTFQLPPLLARRMHIAKDKGREAFIRYFQLPAEERPDTCYYLHTVEAKQRQAGMNKRDIAIAAQMFFWGLVPLPSPIGLIDDFLLKCECQPVQGLLLASMSHALRPQAPTSYSRRSCP